jgi:uncharacterized protein (TIGR03435 family)
MRRGFRGLVVLVAIGGAGYAQTVPAKVLVYDVVSVKVNKSESGGMMWGNTPGGTRMENVRLRDLITSAYALRSPNDEQVTGLPKWAEDTHFDVEAKVSADDLEAYKNLNDEDRARMMLAALQERFKLKAHTETRELPTYSMVVAKGGVKMKLSEAIPPPEPGAKPDSKTHYPGSMSVNMNGSSFHAEFYGFGMEGLAANFSYQVHRQVKDDTGLTGKYDAELNWAPDDAKDATLPGIFTALQDQLGLKLVPAKGPVKCVVIDHVEMPTEN